MSGCRTSISDAEVEHEEEAGNFWHIRYPIKAQKSILPLQQPGLRQCSEIGCSRTPDDDRYAHLVGKTTFCRSWTGDTVIADEYVDSSFGTVR